MRRIRRPPPGEPRPLCCVCGGSAEYDHEGCLYCVRNPCQLAAAGQWTAAQARSELIRRDYKIVLHGASR